MRQVERDQRREAVAPVGDIFERLAVGGFVRVVHRELGTDGAGIGERQADGETGADGRLVDGVEQNGVVVFRDDDAREVIDCFTYPSLRVAPADGSLPPCGGCG